MKQEAYAKLVLTLAQNVMTPLFVPSVTAMLIELILLQPVYAQMDTLMTQPAVPFVIMLVLLVLEPLLVVFYHVTLTANLVIILVVVQAVLMGLS
jgi:hypothetical protein